MGKNCLDILNMSYKLKYGNKEIEIPKNTEFTSHNHVWSQITNKPSTFPPSAHNQDWNTITNKPGSYNPSNHHHAYASWLGKQYASGDEWMGFYDSIGGGTRKGWIGHDGGSTFFMTNETGGNVEIRTKGDYNCGIVLERGNSSYPTGFLYPYGQGGCTLGIMANRWMRYYGSNASNISSDRRLKENFTKFDERYIKLFELIEPCIYNVIESDSTNKEAGFIAQDIEKAMEKCNITQMEFGVYTIDENGVYSLIYQMLNMLLVYYVKEKTKELNRLIQDFNELKKTIKK